MYKGPHKLTLTILEEIRGVQYDKGSVTDALEVTGVIECKVIKYCI